MASCIEAFAVPNGHMFTTLINIYAGKPKDEQSQYYISGGNFQLVNDLVDGLRAYQSLKGLWTGCLDPFELHAIF